MLLSHHFARLYAFFFVSCLASVVVGSAITARDADRTCTSIDHRVEWRTMTHGQKWLWHNAVLCLHNRPATSSWGGATTRFEQYQAVHVQLAPTIHMVGQFLPWHRHIVTMFNNELRTCGYSGPTPYWNWQIDADNNAAPIASSPIFHHEHGFGGDGVPGTYTPPATGMTRPFPHKGCIADGPYRNWVINVGPDVLATPHCLVRGFNEERRMNMTTSLVNVALAQTTFHDFTAILDLNRSHLHAGGHAFVGGEMMNSLSAPGDPIFYLHHAQLDRLWDQWQKSAPGRVMEMGYYTEVGGTVPTTLDYVLTFPGLGPNVTVREVMEIDKKPSCFSYQ